MTPREAFTVRCAERILVFDGGYGTAIQAHKLGEADYRGNLDLSREDLTVANRLLPTADATFGLGEIARQAAEGSGRGGVAYDVRERLEYVRQRGGSGGCWHRASILTVLPRLQLHKTWLTTSV